MFKFITQRGFFVNLLIAVLLVVLIIFLFFNSLDWITHHNDDVSVPLVTGKNVADATKLLEAAGFGVEVIDSVYIDTSAKGSVVRQSPDAAAIVKKNRTVYLTVNRTVAPQVEMPDLRGFSFQSAQMYLQSLSLRLGDTTYRPDIARNSVLEQQMNGKPLAPGAKVSMGSSITLVLGDGVGNVLMNVPNVLGMQLSEARSYLQSLNIGLGATVFDAGVTDKENAYVYKQSPSEKTTDTDGNTKNNKIHPGQVIDVYLSVTEPVVDTTAPPPPDDNNPQ